MCGIKLCRNVFFYILGFFRNFAIHRLRIIKFQQSMGKVRWKSMAYLKKLYPTRFLNVLTS